MKEINIDRIYTILKTYVKRYNIPIVDSIRIRIIWILIVLGYGAGIIAYIIAWIIIPKNPKHKW